MKLIPNFEIDSICRIVWTSKEAKETWGHIIPMLSQFVQELEIQSVVHGQRLYTWQTISENKLIEYTERWAKQGLFSLPAKRVRAFQGFAHRHHDPVQGEIANLCVILSKKTGDAIEYRKAFEAGDHDAQGYFLGFPKCCRDFFKEIWPQGYYDPIWQAAKNTIHKINNSFFCISKDNHIDSVSSLDMYKEQEKNKIRIKAHPYSNPLLRYIGLRVGFHIPCSFSCEETIKIAQERMELAEELDAEKAKLLQALLSMPTSWDCLKGIAVIRTPIFYVITSSVPCEERHVVEIEGKFVPKEGIGGLVFPFMETRNE